MYPKYFIQLLCEVFFFGVDSMLNIVWAVMLVSSFVYSFFAGTSAEVGSAVFQSCTDCISFILKTGAFMVMWSGFMKVAEESSLTDKISSLMSPVICFVFKGVKRGSREAKLISSNLAANMLGLSNAATPLGIAAMQKLAEKSRNGVATNNMCMLAVVNCASLQLVPSTLIALRTSAGSSSPADITVPIWIASVITVVFAVVLTKICEGRDVIG